jgi:dTDP-4-amino-4,6-dideoxygalactose transaminase
MSQSEQTRPVTRTRVPFVDLSPANGLVKQRILDRVAETIDRGDFINGSAVAAFEESFADYCELTHCVGLASGLDALRLGLLASDLGSGARVIVPAATFAATFEAILQAGGVPVLVDVDDADYNIDVAQTADLCGPGVTHLLPVHLYGQLADMRALSGLAYEHGLQIVEDACQAHGARRDGFLPGATARAVTFSFYPAKNLGAMGDAGALLTDDDELAAHVRALRVHGETTKYHHDYLGYTARLDTIQAIVLHEKLPYLDDWTRQRRAAADFYSEALGALEGLRLPQVPEGSEPAWHLYVIRTAEPARLAAFLADCGIQTARHYPEPPHLAPAYRFLGYAPGDFPVAESLSRECLSLPIYPGIREEQLEWVCSAIQDYFRGAAREQRAAYAG